MTDPVSLDEFAEANPVRRGICWCDTLPDDIRTQILASDAPTSVIVKWLKAIGYADASENKVGNWRRAQRS